jgi:CBS domain-containing protein
MCHQVLVVDADATVRMAAEEMRRSAVGCLPVVSAGRLVGMITDRDITVRCLAVGGNGFERVRAVMSPGVVTCFSGETIEAAVQHMIDGGVRRLVVLDREEVVGLFSLDDLAVLETDGQLAGKVLARTVARRGVEMNDLV